MPRYSGKLPYAPVPDPFGQAAADALPQWRRDELIRQADADNGGFISDLAWLLDTPGAMVRGGLSGTGALNALWQSEDERTTGRELLRQYGLAGDEDNWGNFAAGLGTEIVLDPLSLLSGWTKALTPAGKAARAAGLLDRAPATLSKAYVAGKELAPELAQRADSALQSLGRSRDAISATDVVGRPLIGRRAANKFGTLQNLVDYADDPQKARQSLLDALKGDTGRLDSLMGQNLGRDLGVGLPLMDPSFSINVPGGTAAADALDTALGWARWSAPGRFAHALTNNAVGQATDAESQMLFQGADAARKQAMSDARSRSAFQAAKLFQSEPDVFTEEGNRALGRLIEKPVGSAFEQADSIWDSAHPAARAYRQWWDEQAAALPEEFTEAGLRGATFEDPFIQGYLPRQTDGMLEQAGRKDGTLGRVLRTLTSDQMRRSQELRIPGGRDTLAFELSRDPVVAGSKRLAKTDDEAAKHIAQKLYGKRWSPDENDLLEGIPAFDQETRFPGPYWKANPDGTHTFSPHAGAGETFVPGGIPDEIAADGKTYLVEGQEPLVFAKDYPHLFLEQPADMLLPAGVNIRTAPGAELYSPQQWSQAQYLAKLLHRLPENVIKEQPLFGQHPVASISKYVEGRAGAKATIESMYDSLSGIAATKPAELVEGGRHISMAEALNRIGARTLGTDAGEVGAREQIRRRLGARMGIDPDKVDLASISVPEDHVNRLTRVIEGYKSPQAAEDISKLLNEYTRWWKAGILSWPSRIVRDLYSGAFSNWLEGAFDLESVGAARMLAAKSAFDPEFIAFLKKTPKYASIPDSDVAARFYADLAGTGLFDGGYRADARMAVAGGQVQDMLVGVQPQTFRGALGELGGNWGGFFNLDTNPIARAGVRAGDLSDKINRLTGYLSLLKQGVAPEEAARRMKRAHVDYSSLTPIERQIRDSVFPFYAYTSRIFKEVARQMAERPGGRYGQMLRTYERMQEGEDEYVPEELRSKFAARIDPEDPLFGWMAADPSVGNTYFTGIDLPGLQPLGLMSGDASTRFGNVLMMTNPLMRTAAETITGRDFFLSSPIDETSRSYGPIGKGIRAYTDDPMAGGGRAVTFADKALDLVPFASRPARMAAQIYDEDAKINIPTKLFQTGVNFAGIGRLKDITADRARADAIRKLQELAAPYTKEITIPTIPKGMEHTVPQDSLDALALSRQLQRESRESRRQKQKLFANPFE